MKLRILILVLVIIKFFSVQGQTPYYDALTLSKYVSPVTHKFASDPSQADTIRAIFIRYSYSQDSSNVFLRAYLTPGRPLATGRPPINLKLNDGLSSIRGLDITNIADGFAKFLVKRTKEELNAAFFSKFKELINKPEFKDVQILFPQTYLTLQAIGSEIYNFQAYIHALRESFEIDLNNLLPNLKKIIDDERYRPFFTSHPELKAICLSSIYVGEGLIHKIHPGKILADFPAEDYLVSLPNVKGAVQTLQLFSESLRSKGSTSYWISNDSLKLLTRDPVALNIYLGLIYQKAGNPEIVFAGTTTLRSILTNANDLRRSVVNYLHQLQAQTDLVTASIATISKKTKEELTFADYYSVYNSALDLLEHASHLDQVHGLEFLQLNQATINSIRTARIGGNVALDINRRNYASAVINIYQLYAASIPDASTESVKPLILKYGSFMAAVAQAENSDEVADAIEAVALPSGSSSIKRQTDFNVSLNAYVGLFAGYERIKGVDKSDFKVNSYGVAAPIGVSISRGHSIFFLGTGKKGWKEDKYGWSSSVFLSVVDIGALAAFRFTNDNTQTVPKIELKDIISPGVFFSLGIPKSPLSVNFGYQIGPILREVSTKVNTYEKNYSRISITLCVDIPLLNFYTKTSSK